jgi:hypothetical protein
VLDRGAMRAVHSDGRHRCPGIGHRAVGEHVELISETAAPSSRECLDVERASCVKPVGGSTQSDGADEHVVKANRVRCSAVVQSSRR